MDRKGDTMLASGFRGWRLLGILLATTLLVPIVPVAASAAGARAGCDPAIVVLPAESETAGAAVRAMNDGGLVAGVSFDWDQDIPAHVVVWDAMEPPTVPGIGGVRRANGSSVSGHAVDVNEAGVVAAQRYGYSASGGLRATAVVLWDAVNGKSVLPALPQRPRAEVSALNDLGVAVGSARGRGRPSIPVYWRDGDVRRLPLPRGATGGYAIDNNNRGLIVGQVVVDRQSLPWWWRRGAGNGPLSVRGVRSAPGVIAVDDRDRVVGLRHRSFDRSGVFLWRGPSARPRHILGLDGGVTTMGGTRHLAGHDGGFRGFDDRAWVARLGDRRATSLPDPPLEDPDGWWANTFAWALTRGETAFAPQGGITVGGSAETDDETPVRAVLWTCAQTYLE